MALFRFGITFLLSFCIYNLNGQTHRETLERISKKLVSHATSDHEKVDIIFHWITDSIDYDFEVLEKAHFYPLSVRNSKTREEYSDAVALYVIKEGKAVCDGYARLFQRLCMYAGVEARYVAGRVKRLKGRELGSHAWNAVKLNGEWYLLDPTWASGHRALGEPVFVKSYNPHYYLTPPEKMIIDHYPDDQFWTLLSDEVTYRDFINSTARSALMFHEGVKDYWPKNKHVIYRRGENVTISLDLDSTKSVPQIMLSDRSGAYKEGTNFLKLSSYLTGVLHVVPTYGLIIPKFKVVEIIQTNTRIDIHLKALSMNWKILKVYVGSYYPSLVYKVDVDP